jgi:hypothetical protein
MSASMTALFDYLPGGKNINPLLSFGVLAAANRVHSDHLQ